MGVSPPIAGAIATASKAGPQNKLQAWMQAFFGAGNDKGDFAFELSQDNKSCTLRVTAFEVETPLEFTGRGFDANSSREAAIRVAVAESTRLLSLMINGAGRLSGTERGSSTATRSQTA